MATTRAKYTSPFSRTRNLYSSIYHYDHNISSSSSSSSSLTTSLHHCYRLERAGHMLVEPIQPELLH